MVSSLPCILSSRAMVQVHRSHSVLVHPNTGEISLTQTAVGWWWSAIQTQIQTMSVTDLQALIQQSMCTVNLHQSGTAPHPGLYLLTSAWSPSRETAAIHIFKALQLSAWCKPNQSQTKLSAYGLDHSSQRTFPVSPSLTHTTLPTQPVSSNKEPTRKSGQHWTFHEPVLDYPPCHCSH